MGKICPTCLFWVKLRATPRASIKLGQKNNSKKQLCHRSYFETAMPLAILIKFHMTTSDCKVQRRFHRAAHPPAMEQPSRQLRSVTSSCPARRGHREATMVAASQDVKSHWLNQNFQRFDITTCSRMTRKTKSYLVPVMPPLTKQLSFLVVVA